MRIDHIAKDILFFFIIFRRQQYVGKVSHALFDPTGKKIVVGTEENVVAVLHSSTGQ